MIRSIIVDDEKPAREVLKNYLAEFCPDIHVMEMAGTMKSGLNAVLQHRPDLLFLDVEMPDGTGFDLLRNLHRVDFRVIFVTAYSEYAINAFRFCATDYLLKPVNIQELMESVEKVRKEMASQPDPVNIEELLSATKNQESAFPSIVIPDKKGFAVLPVHEIIYCEADGYCTRFHMKKGTLLTSSKNLKYYEEILGMKGFLRVHHSYLVNLREVNGYDSSGLILINDGQSVPLGNTYKKRFLDRFDNSRQ
jgi:two-component system, LytTR family, response regulator